MTNNLLGWLDHWHKVDETGRPGYNNPKDIGAPMVWDGKPISAIEQTFVRHAEECHLPEFAPGTIRQQRDVWLGHDEKRTANE